MSEVLYITNDVGEITDQLNNGSAVLQMDGVKPSAITCVEIKDNKPIVREYVNTEEYRYEPHDLTTEEKESKLRKEKINLLKRLIIDMKIPEEHMLRLFEVMDEKDLEKLSSEGLEEKITEVKQYKEREKIFLEFIEGIPKDTLKSLYKIYPELESTIKTNNGTKILEIFAQNPDMFQVIFDGNKKIESILKLTSDKEKAQKTIESLNPEIHDTYSVVSDHIEYERNYAKVLIDVSVFDNLYESAIELRLQIIEKISEIVATMPELENDEAIKKVLEDYTKLIYPIDEENGKNNEKAKPQQEIIAKRTGQKNFSIDEEKIRHKILEIHSEGKKNLSQTEKEIQKIVEDMANEEINRIGVLELSDSEEYSSFKDIILQVKKRNPDVFLNFQSIDFTQEESDKSGSRVTRESIRQLVRGMILADLGVKGEEKKCHVIAKNSEGKKIADVGKRETLVSRFNTNDWKEYLVSLINFFINADTDRSVINHVIDVAMTSKQFLMSDAFKSLALNLSEGFDINGLFNGQKYNSVTGEIEYDSLNVEVIITMLLTSLMHDIGKADAFPDEMNMNATKLAKTTNDNIKNMHTWKGGLIIQDFMMKCDNMPPQIRKMMGVAFETALFHHALTDGYSLPEESIVVDENSPEYMAAKAAGLPFYIKAPEKGRVYETEELQGHKSSKIEMSDEAKMYIVIDSLSDQTSAMARTRAYNRISPMESIMGNICEKFKIKAMAVKEKKDGDLYNNKIDEEEIDLESYSNNIEQKMETVSGLDISFDEYMYFTPNKEGGLIESDELNLETVIAMFYLNNFATNVYWQDQAQENGKTKESSSHMSFFDINEVDKNSDLGKSLSYVTTHLGTHVAESYAGAKVEFDDEKKDKEKVNRPASKLDFKKIGDIFQAIVTGKYNQKEINREQIMSLIAGKEPFMNRRLAVAQDR